MTDERDQLSREELEMIIGGNSSKGILSLSTGSKTSPIFSNCTGGTCKNSCTPGCSAGCSSGCVQASGKDGFSLR